MTRAEAAGYNPSQVGHADDMGVYTGPSMDALVRAMYGWTIPQRDDKGNVIPRER